MAKKPTAEQISAADALLDGFEFDKSGCPERLGLTELIMSRMMVKAAGEVQGVAEGSEIAYRMYKPSSKRIGAHFPKGATSLTVELINDRFIREVAFALKAVEARVSVDYRFPWMEGDKPQEWWHGPFPPADAPFSKKGDPHPRPLEDKDWVFGTVEAPMADLRDSMVRHLRIVTQDPSQLRSNVAEVETWRVPGGL